MFCNWSLDGSLPISDSRELCCPMPLAKSHLSRSSRGNGALRSYRTSKDLKSFYSSLLLSQKAWWLLTDGELGLCLMRYVLPDLHMWCNSGCRWEPMEHRKAAKAKGQQACFLGQNQKKTSFPHAWTCACPGRTALVPLCSQMLPRQSSVPVPILCICDTLGANQYDKLNPLDEHISPFQSINTKIYYHCKSVRLTLKINCRFNIISNRAQDISVQKMNITQSDFKKKKKKVKNSGSNRHKSTTKNKIFKSSRA